MMYKFARTAALLSIFIQQELYRIHPQQEFPALVKINANHVEELSTSDGWCDVFNVSHGIRDGALLGAHYQTVEVGMNYDRSKPFELCYQLQIYENIYK